MSSPVDVLIVGGGVVGLATALELSRRGAGVTLLERGRVGDRLTSGLGAAAGAVAAQARTRAEPEASRDLALLGRHLWPAWAEGLEAASGLSTEFEAAGGIAVARSDPEEVALDRALDWQRARRLPVEVLSPEEAVEREPSLSPDLTAAFAFPLEGQVAAARLARALLLAARAAGVRLVEECPVHAIRTAGSRVEGAETGVGRITAATVVNCGGAFASRLPGVPPLPLVPYRTEAVRLDASADAERPSRIVVAPDVLLVPSRDATLTAASTVGSTGFDARPAAAALGALLSRAASVVPAASVYPVMEIWAAVSPVTPDGVPLLGETDVGGYWAATGLGPWGLTSGPAAAVLVADLLSGTLPALPTEPFAPRRFGPAGEDPW